MKITICNIIGKAITFLLASAYKIQYANFAKLNIMDTLSIISGYLLSITSLYLILKVTFGLFTLKFNKLRWRGLLVSEIVFLLTSIAVIHFFFTVSAFFFIQDTCYMELNKVGILWCSHDRIWSVFEKKIGVHYDEIQIFIKNVVEMYFKNKEVTPEVEYSNVLEKVEMHFRNKEIMPRPLANNLFTIDGEIT